MKDVGPARPGQEAALRPGVIEGVVIRQAGEAPVAAILSVGSELLLGDLTDTNATWISRRLTERGVEVVHHLAVRDELDELVTSLRWLADRAHLVIVGGGLGPTSDDLTREAVAAAAEVELEHREELAEMIAARFRAMDRRMVPANLRQARIPAGARALPPAGTAPGFALTLPGRSPARVVALPGVPWELRQLWDEHVDAEVTALAGPRATVTRILHVVGRGESEVATIVEPLVAARPDAALAFLAKGHEVQVRLTVSDEGRDAAFAAAQPLVEELIDALDGAVVGVDDEDLETVVLSALAAAGQSLATAESATGGDISARLARVPGASASFLGGAVVYATDTKRALLELPRSLLEEHGAVSEPVTEALATAVRERTGADWGLAVTGVAGPASVDGLAVGTCYWALAHPDGRVEVHGQRIPGDRRQVIGRLGSAALDLLRRRLTTP